MQDLEPRVKGLFIKLFDMKPEELTLEANLNDDLGMDSTEMVELIVALEKEFKIQIEDGEITNKNCLRDVLKLVEEKLKQ